MLTAISALALAAAGSGVLWLKARRDHREALAHRAALLDDACALFPDARVAIGTDGFPSLSFRLDDGREARLLLIADSLVTRRLPQLWLALTILDATPQRRFSIGALARPTGAEYYSRVHPLPDFVEPPDGDVPLLMRAAALPRHLVGQAARALALPFADPRLKEAVLSPRGISIVRQACEGDRGAHLLLRQARFDAPTVPADMVEQAIADALVLEGAFDRLAPAPAVPA
ncbi:MAG: hypothetical protein ABWZ57_17905 [Mesorhizobium sp.]